MMKLVAMLLALAAAVNADCLDQLINDFELSEQWLDCMAPYEDRCSNEYGLNLFPTGDTGLMQDSFDGPLTFAQCIRPYREHCCFLVTGSPNRAKRQSRPYRL